MSASPPTAVGGLIDSHCHLEMMKGAVRDALRRAAEAGVEEMVTVGINVPSSVQAIALAHGHPEVHATVGLHPHDASAWNARTREELERLAHDRRVVAIGECGLDYYRDLSPREAQREAFVGQMELARRLSKPLVVHIRDAGDEAMALLASHGGGLQVVLHCFSQPEAVEECVRRGYYISFAGNVTYKSAHDLRRAARLVPDERILVETDAPFLTPVPYRGKQNEPARVLLTAALLAEERGQDGRAFAELTAANARRVFSLSD